MTQCPCGSTLDYLACCQPIHNDPTNAKTPEQLMRSRYCAHVKGLVDFVVETYHPSCNAHTQRNEISDSIDSEWAGLEVLSAEDGSHSDEGFVTFKAYFNQEGQQYCLEERSRFLRENGQWFYIDGEFPDADTAETTTASKRKQETKVGRNDPCICGSGKKFKKCCG